MPAQPPPPLTRRHARTYTPSADTRSWPSPPSPPLSAPSRCRSPASSPPPGGRLPPGPRAQTISALAPSGIRVAAASERGRPGLGCPLLPPRPPPHPPRPVPEPTRQSRAGGGQAARVAGQSEKRKERRWPRETSLRVATGRERCRRAGPLPRAAGEGRCEGRCNGRGEEGTGRNNRPTG